MEDRIERPAQGRVSRGSGYYHETYRLAEGNWRIARMRLDRVRMDSEPL